MMSKREDGGAKTFGLNIPEIVHLCSCFCSTWTVCVSPSFNFFIGSTWCFFFFLRTYTAHECLMREKIRREKQREGARTRGPFSFSFSSFFPFFHSRFCYFRLVFFSLPPSFYLLLSLLLLFLFSKKKSEIQIQNSRILEIATAGQRGGVGTTGTSPPKKIRNIHNLIIK